MLYQQFKRKRIVSVLAFFLARKKGPVEAVAAEKSLACQYKENVPLASELQRYPTGITDAFKYSSYE